MVRSTMRLIQLAILKWRQRASVAIARRIIKNRGTEYATAADDTEPKIADKGHFVVYSIDGRRFVVPVKYLNGPIIGELFRIMSTEEPDFGDRITLPCDGVFTEYLLSLVRMRVRGEVEKAVIAFLSCCRYSASSSSSTLFEGQSSSQPPMVVEGF